ncbi:MAG TPA: C39 family peptidase [Ktedonobacteraceae bacterium]|nr:C39 family peptidase [Ktedonobacteraceae bacterium]
MMFSGWLLVVVLFVLLLTLVIVVCRALAWLFATPSRRGLGCLVMVLGLGLLAYRAFGGAVSFGPIGSQAAPGTVHHVVRISQLDPNQYSSVQEYRTWSGSACSAASMTEVMNAYGRSYRITDVLAVEARIGEIAPASGLLEEAGIEKTVQVFGFAATWGHQLSLDRVIAIANQGKPVIVGFPPQRWAGGHLLVVTGGDSSTVLLADSSGYNMPSLARSRFLSYWGGFSAVVTPKEG